MSPLTEADHQPMPLVAVIVGNAPDTIPHSAAAPAAVPLKERFMARVDRPAPQLAVRWADSRLVEQVVAWCAGRHSPTLLSK